MELKKVDVESLEFDYPIDHNDIIMDTCREIIHNEKSKINLDKDLSNVEFGKWLDSSERLQEMARRILESL